MAVDPENCIPLLIETDYKTNVGRLTAYCILTVCYLEPVINVCDNVVPEVNQHFKHPLGDV